MAISFPNATDAIYTPCLIPEYSGNPLIDALPPIASDENIFSRLTYFPKVSDLERSLPPEVRRHIAGRAETLVVPTPEYLMLYRMIEGALLKSYRQKNPFSPTTSHYLHYLNPSDTEVQPYSGAFRPEGTAMTLVGPSGVGKSHMIHSVLNTIPQAIKHSSYQGHDLNLSQLTWVKVDCPSDGSRVSFCKQALSAIDEAAGTDLYGDARKKRDTKADLLLTFEKAIRNKFIGVFCVDETSNLEAPKKGNANPLLSFLLNLINSSGVPILFSGNEEMLEVFTKKLRVARRVENGGFLSMGPMLTDMWILYVKQLWKLQVTNPPTPFNMGLAQHLKNITCAVPDLATRTFIETQKILIGTRDERITETALDEGKREALALTTGMLSWYDDDNYSTQNYIPENIDEGEQVNVAGTGSYKRTPNKNLPDPSRPQHPEFETTLYKLMDESSFSMAKVQPTLIVDSPADGNCMDYLVESGAVLTDPLNLVLMAK